MSTSASDGVSSIKELFSQGKYEEAAKIIILVEYIINELKSKGNDAEADKIESEISKLKTPVFEKAIDNAIDNAKDLTAKKDSSCVFAVLKAEKFAEKINKTLDIEKLKNNAYQIGIESKIAECTNYLKNGNFDDALKAYKTAEIFGNIVGKPVSGKILSEIYTGLCKSETEKAKKELKDKNINCIEKFFVAEKYAEYAENAVLSKDVAHLKKAVLKFGVESKTEEAKNLSKKDSVKALVAILSAEQYASQSNIAVRTEPLKKEIYENLIGAKFNEAKANLKNRDYKSALSALAVIRNSAKTSRIEKTDGKVISAEVEKLQKSAYNTAIENLILEGKNAIKNKDYTTALANCNLTNIYAAKLNIKPSGEVENLRKDAYKTACYSKITEANELLNKGDVDGYAALNVATAYAKKANIPVPTEIEKIKPKAHEVFANYKFNAAKETLETDPGDSVVNLLLTEKHTKLANAKLPADFEKIKNKAYTNGINAKIKDAEEALKANDYEGAIGPLSVARTYAERTNVKVPEKVEELRKNAYAIGVNAKIADVKQALADKDYGAAVGGCNVVDLFAGRAGITAPKELSDLRSQSYKLAAEEKLKEAKEAVNNKEYSDAFGACAGVEIYSKKANIAVPKEVEELRKNAYKIACYSKIDEANELLNQDNADGYAALNTAEAYSKKANIQVPAEIEKIKPKAHEVFANYKFNAAKETLETDPGDSVVNLLLTEKHTKLANAKLPADFEKIKNKAYTNGINAKIKDAEEALKANDYEGAIGPLSVARTYAERTNVKVPEKVEELRKNAYAIGVNAKIADVKQALADKDYGAAVGGCNVVDLFAGRAGITAPKELSDLRLHAYNLAITEKLKEGEEGIKHKDYGEVFAACAGAEIYGKKANIDVKKEFSEINSMWMEGYKLAYYTKLNEAKDLMSQNDSGCYAALKSAEKYAEDAGMTLPDVTIESLKKDAYRVVINSKESDINRAIKEGNYGDAIAAFNGLTYYVNISGLSSKDDINQLKKKVLSVGIDSKLKDAEEAYNSRDFASGLSALSIAEAFANTIGVSADKILLERKKITASFLNAKTDEIAKLLNEGNFDDAIIALRGAERQSAKANVPFPEKFNEISKKVYDTGISVKIKEANDALTVKDFSGAYVSLENAKEFAAKTGKTVPEIDVLKNKCFEIGVEEKINSAKKNISENNYEDATADIIAAKGYATKAGKSINVSNLEKDAYKIGINAQIEELKKAINSGSYDDATLAYYTIKLYAEKISTNIPPEVDTLMMDVYNIGYKVKQKEAINHATINEFTEAIGCLKEAAYCAEKSGIDISTKFEEMQNEIYTNGIKSKLKNATNALLNAEYLETLGNLKVAEAYAKESRINFSQIARDAGFDVKKITYDAYISGIKKNLDIARKAADKGERYEALSAAAIVHGYADTLEIEDPAELTSIIAEAEKKK